MKNFRVILSLFILIFLGKLPHFAQIQAGSTLWYSGFDAGVSSQGFGGVASKNSGFFTSVNPATAATIKDFRMFSSGSIESPNFSAMLGVASPTSPGGTIYASTEYLHYDQTALTRVGYGKKVRSDLALGMEGILNFHNDPARFHIGGGFSFGILWLPKDPLPIKNGWGFADFSFGSKMKLVFFPISGISDNPAPHFVLQNGIEATFMDYGKAKWKFIADYALGVAPLQNKNSVSFLTWFSLATSFTFWNVWEIGVGTILGNNNLGFGANQILPFTFSTAFGYEWDSFSMKLRYNLGADMFFDELEYRHTVGMELGFGQKNKKNVRATLFVNNNRNLLHYFSPNGDGVEDTLTLLPSIIETNNINAWRINIQNELGQVVKVVEQSPENVDDSYSVADFFKAYFIPSKSTIIPERIIWDGKDRNQQVVPDGVYVATLQLRYNEDQITTSQSNIIFVDNTAPTAKITPNVKTLYLGDDTTKKLEFIQEMSPDAWKVKFVDESDNSALGEWSWNEGEAPLTNSWGLKNPARVNVASGTYSYIATSIDKAGNSNTIIVTNIGIETKPRKPILTSSEKAFSAKQNTNGMKISLGEIATVGLTGSKFILYNSAGAILQSTNLDISNMPAEMIWDGKDPSGKIIADGSYLFILENSYDDNQVFHSDPLIFEFDNTAPTYKIDYMPKRFSPDKDGINDDLQILLMAQDVTGVESWSISVRNDNGETLKEFSGKELESVLSWNPEKGLLKTAQFIYLDLRITDTLKNSSETRVASIKIDVLLDNTDKNLILSDSRGYFTEGKGILEDNIFSYLDEIYELTKDYPTDVLVIKTGSYLVEALDSEYEANRLAILRSESVKAYLVRKGIPARNIRAEFSVSDEKNRAAQNELRRVRITLEKDRNTL
ncbi:MAG: hypothetical protein ACRCS8_04100 [Brevinema sp.]